MKKKKEDMGFLPICLVLITLVVLIVYENFRTKDEPIKTEETLLVEDEYQIFEDYQFKVKCPVTLKDASMQSNDDFDFNYAGSTDDTFYQIMIIKIPAGRLYLTREEEKEFLVNMFEGKGGGKSVLWGDENLPAYLLNDYTQEGRRGRGIAVARNGKVYVFNVITKSDLDATFNSFTNSVKFLDDRILEKDDSSLQSSDELLMTDYKKHGKGSYSISYPKGWMLKENPNEIVNISVNAPENGNSESEANFNVIISEDNNSLETKFQLAQKQCEEHILEYKLISKDKISIEGLNCFKTIAKANMQSVDIISIGYQFKKLDDTTYTITFTVHADYYYSYEPIFHQIIQSFKLL